MKVSELIERLKDENQNKEVLIDNTTDELQQVGSVVNVYVPIDGVKQTCVLLIGE